MGIAELALIAVTAALTCTLAVVGARVLTSPRELVRRPSAVPIPVATLVVAGVSIPAAPALSWWLAAALVESVTAAVPHGLIQRHPSDPALALAYAAVLITVWAVTPGAAVIAWLLFSSRRSTTGAVLFAAATWIGGTLGLVAAVSLASNSMAQMLAGGLPIPDIHVSMVDAVAMVVRAGLGGGFCGASAAAICVVAASSKRGLQAAQWATTTLPLVASTIGAIATPPDLISQLGLAIPITVTWLAGLGLGVAARPALRAKRES